MIKSNSFKDLIVWQKSMDLAVSVYSVTEKIPEKEKYGISSQVQRSAISIPSNIAEGSKRGSSKEFVHFLKIAFGSSAELETQLILIHKIYKLTSIPLLLSEVEGIQKMLSVLIKKVDSSKN